MSACYVKAYFDWIEQTAALSDAERGRLFIAILEYARSGLDPKLDGREGILFPVFKSTIDRDTQKSARLSENGAKGGRGNKAAESKQKQNKSNESKEKPNIRHKTEEKDKEIIIPHYVRDYCAEPQATHAPPAVELPLNDGDIYPVTQEQVAEWGSLYPAVDVMQQLRAMKGWLNATPAKRKTRRGILRFVNAWLSREQDRGRGAPAKPAEPVRKYNHDTGKWEIVEG